MGLLIYTNRKNVLRVGSRSNFVFPFKSISGSEVIARDRLVWRKNRLTSFSHMRLSLDLSCITTPLWLWKIYITIIFYTTFHEVYTLKAAYRTVGAYAALLWSASRCSLWSTETAAEWEVAAPAPSQVLISVHGGGRPVRCGSSYFHPLCGEVRRGFPITTVKPRALFEKVHTDAELCHIFTFLSESCHASLLSFCWPLRAKSTREACLMLLKVEIFLLSVSKSFCPAVSVSFETVVSF